MKTKLKNKLIKEMCSFRADIMKMSKDEIYEMADVIVFYEKIYDYMICEYTVKDEDEIMQCLKVENFIKTLYNYCIDEYCLDMNEVIASVVTYNDIDMLLESFLEGEENEI